MDIVSLIGTDQSWHILTSLCDVVNNEDEMGADFVGDTLACLSGRHNLMYYS